MHVTGKKLNVLHAESDYVKTYESVSPVRVIPTYYHRRE